MQMPIVYCIHDLNIDVTHVNIWSSLPCQLPRTILTHNNSINPAKFIVNRARPSYCLLYFQGNSVVEHLDPRWIIYESQRAISRKINQKVHNHVQAYCWLVEM